MKSHLRLVLLSVAAVVVAGLAYLQYEHVIYVRTYLEERVGLRDFSLRQKVHNHHQWYAKMDLGKGEATKLLTRFPFAPNYNQAILGGRRAVAVGQVALLPTTIRRYCHRRVSRKTSLSRTVRVASTT